MPGQQVFYDHASRMKIWRVPEPHLENPEKYSDRGREYWQVWNREVPIDTFARHEAPKYVEVSEDHVVQHVILWVQSLVRCIHAASLWA